MPTYEYRCPECGIIEKFHPIGEMRSAEPCPNCASKSTRIFSVPLVSQLPKHVATTAEQAEKSGHEPAVTTRDPDRSSGNTHPISPSLEKLVGKDAARRLRTARHPADPVS